MSDVKLDTIETKASYGIGLQMGQQLAQSGLEGLNVAAIAKGIATSLAGEMPEIEVDDINNALRELHTTADAARQEQAKLASVSRGQPAEFPVTGVIAGWVEALQMMPVGSKWKLSIPQNLAYGERGAGAAIPPYAALVFEVELLDIL
jgi:FKBP-type peptidyl-prolyl cis-trans isomerase FklB